jgi:hypothetical protein
VTTDERLLELAASVRTYKNMPGVIYGQPSTLSEICRLLGFKNRCERGRVYLTGPKIRRLGLPTATEVLLAGMAAHG